MADHSPKTTLFTRVFIALCVLTALSLAVAQIDLPENRLIIWLSMIAISTCKALLVIAFFMHLKWEKAWKWVLTIPALLMGITLTVALIPDIGQRAQHQNGDATSATETQDNKN